MIHSLAWNDETNMLAALTDGKFIVWYYPNTAYVDRDLMSRTTSEKEARYYALVTLLSPTTQTLQYSGTNYFYFTFYFYLFKLVPPFFLFLNVKQVATRG